MVVPAVSGRNYSAFNTNTTNNYQSTVMPVTVTYNAGKTY